jgi:hypothetical protein
VRRKPNYTPDEGLISPNVKDKDGKVAQRKEGGIKEDHDHEDRNYQSVINTRNTNLRLNRIVDAKAMIGRRCDSAGRLHVGYFKDVESC